MMKFEVEFVDGNPLTLIEIRNQYINFVMKMAKNKTDCAKLLGINRRTLYRRDKLHTRFHEVI